MFLKNNFFWLILFAVNITLLFLHILFGENHDFFSFDREYNLPTAWASLQALLAAGAWLWWHQTMKNDTMKKISFAIFKFAGFFLLVYIALDEFFQWHEFFGDQLGLYLQSIGWGEMFWRHNPVFAWLLVFAPALLALGIFFLWGAWRAWPRAVFWRVCAAASLFVLGSYGMEFLGSLSFNEVWQKIPYWYLITIEETLEFLSIAFLTSIFYKQIILNKNKL
ncbi:MAG TPA: hypothetical protein PLB38_00605 [bacterium]|nr:hypothetical protein [bacterium]